MSNTTVLSSTSTLWNGVQTCINNFERNPMASFKDLGRAVFYGAMATAATVFCGRYTLREMTARGITTHSQDLALLSLGFLVSSGLSVYLTYLRFCEREVEDNEELLDVLGGPSEMNDEVSDEDVQEAQYEEADAMDYDDVDSGDES